MKKIGKTPLIRLKEFEKFIHTSARIYAKMESKNPFGSIKDRVALKIIEKAQNEKLINNNTCIIEATSGNMGIALAGISQILGYKSKIIMPENMSEGRKKLILNYGAELVLTSSNLGMGGAITKAQEIYKTTNNCYYCDQFNNLASIEAHISTTAPEIYEELNGNIYMGICGIGTGATITGLGKYLKSINPTINIIGILPRIYPHKIQGIGAGFIPPLLNMNFIDQIIDVDDEESFYEMDKINNIEGIGVGISSGAVIAGLKRLLITSNFENKNIVLVFPDGDDRY